jgi:hypothetical protein
MLQNYSWKTFPWKGKKDETESSTRTAPQGPFSLESFHQQVDLPGQKLWRALIADDKVGQLSFARQRQLLGYTSLGLLSRDPTRFETGVLLGGSSGDADDEIKPIL